MRSQRTGQTPLLALSRKPLVLKRVSNNWNRRIFDSKMFDERELMIL
jgi:hypothetical protein